MRPTHKANSWRPATGNPLPEFDSTLAVLGDEREERRSGMSFFSRVVIAVAIAGGCLLGVMAGAPNLMRHLVS